MQLGQDMFYGAGNENKSAIKKNQWLKALHFIILATLQLLIYNKS